MLAEYVIASLDITFAVVVRIYVLTFNGRAALITLEVLILILMRCTFYLGAAFVTLKVAVVIDVSRASASAKIKAGNIEVFKTRDVEVGTGSQS